MIRSSLVRRTLGTAGLCLVAVPVRAQVVVVDEGILTITVAGERVGREDFSIRRNVADGGFIAQGNVLRAESRSVVALTTDSTGLPFRFQVERFVAGRRAENTSGFTSSSEKFFGYSTCASRFVLHRLMAALRISSSAMIC